MLKNFSKDILIYGAGNVVAKSISFLTIPVYTRIFSPSEFGLLEMILVINGIFGAIALLGLDSAQSLYFNKFKEKGIQTQKEVVTSILQLRIAWGGLVLIIATFTLPFWALLVFTENISPQLFFVAFLGTLFFQISSQAIDLLRILFKPFRCVVLTCVQSILTVAIILLLIIKFDWGIEGFFLGSLIAAALSVCFCWFQIRQYIASVKPLSEYWPVFLKFGIPLIPDTLLLHGMLVLDRIFLQLYHDMKTVGVYAIGFKFTVVMSVIVEVFRKAWWPYAMKYMYAKESETLFRDIAQLYILFTCICALLITLISPPLITFIVGAQYQESWKIVGILCLQPVFYGFILIGGLGIWKLEKTKYNFYITFIALLLGLIFNYLLVPKYSILGAAVATAITYFFWACMSLMVSERLWKINYPITKIGIYLISTVLGITSYTLFNFEVINLDILFIILIILIQTKSLVSVMRRLGL